MKIEKEHIDKIKVAFAKMQTREDLLALLNYAKYLVYGKKAFSFELRQLTWYASPKLNRKRYTEFKIRKRSGQNRIINAPVKGLKAIQKTLAFILQCVFEPHKAATGFIRNRSIVNNARLHEGNRYIYNIDLKDFFSSIDQARVWKCMQLTPFNLIDNEPTITFSRRNLANIIASLCCTELIVERKNDKEVWELVKRNVLPQGAPTSPAITNIVCQRLDYLLSGVAKRFGLKYSRYADDITFSSMHNVYQNESDFIKELCRIIEDQNFHIKSEKTRLQKEGHRQEVTGLLVNQKTNVRKHYIKELRLWLYYWEQYGYDRASIYFTRQYITDKPHEKIEKPNLSNVIYGKLNYLRMVKGAECELYLKLKSRFDKLSDSTEKPYFKPISITSDTIVVHKPTETTKFLKYFKYDNKYSFKELVHTPIDEAQFDYSRLLKIVSSQYLEYTKSSKNKIILPKNLVFEVQRLFKTLSTDGFNFFERTHLHPLEDKNIGLMIQQFKGNYRFGNEKGESSILSTLITNIAKKRSYNDLINNITYSFGVSDTSGLFKIDQIKFLPDIQRFQSKANFFTWVPNVRMALVQIFDSIIKHSNIAGSKTFDNWAKEIIIEISRRLDLDVIKVELSILDRSSLYLGDLNSMMRDMRRDFYPLLVGVCDFKLHFNTIDNKTYECKVLPYAEKIEEINNKVDGFKYQFTFFD